MGDADTTRVFLETCRKAGNEAFRAKDMERAKACYDQAIEKVNGIDLRRHDSDDGLRDAVHFLYNNRALVSWRQGDLQAAEADCDKALLIEPFSIKANRRRGLIRKARGRLIEAAEDFGFTFGLVQLERDSKSSSLSESSIKTMLETLRCEMTQAYEKHISNKFEEQKPGKELLAKAEASSSASMPTLDNLGAQIQKHNNVLERMKMHHDDNDDLTDLGRNIKETPQKVKENLKGAMRRIAIEIDEDDDEDYDDKLEQNKEMEKERFQGGDKDGDGDRELKSAEREVSREDACRMVEKWIQQKEDKREEIDGKDKIQQVSATRREIEGGGNEDNHYGESSGVGSEKIMAMEANANRKKKRRKRKKKKKKMPVTTESERKSDTSDYDATVEGKDKDENEKETSIMEDPRAREEFSNYIQERKDRFKTLDPLKKFEEMQNAIGRAGMLVASAFQAAKESSPSRTQEKENRENDSTFDHHRDYSDDTKQVKENSENNCDTDEENVDINLPTRLNEEAKPFYRARKFTDAEAKYTKALKALDRFGEDGPIFEPELRVKLLCNRALCHLAQGQWAHAEMDCSEALEIHPSNLSAIRRRAKARASQHLHKEAAEDFEVAIDILTAEQDCGEQSKEKRAKDAAILSEMKRLLEESRKALTNVEDIEIECVDTDAPEGLNRTTKHVGCTDNTEHEELKNRIPLKKKKEVEAENGVTPGEEDVKTMVVEKEEEENDEGREGKGEVKQEEKTGHFISKRYNPRTAVQFNQELRAFHRSEKEENLFRYLRCLAEGALCRVFGPEGSLEVDMLTRILKSLKSAAGSDPKTCIRVLDDLTKAGRIELTLMMMPDRELEDLATLFEALENNTLTDRMSKNLKNLREFYLDS